VASFFLDVVSGPQPRLGGHNCEEPRSPEPAPAAERRLPASSQDTGQRRVSGVVGGDLFSRFPEALYRQTKGWPTTPRPVES